MHGWEASLPALGRLHKWSHECADNLTCDKPEPVENALQALRAAEMRLVILEEEKEVGKGGEEKKMQSKFFPQ